MIHAPLGPRHFYTLTRKPWRHRKFINNAFSSQLALTIQK